MALISTTEDIDLRKSYEDAMNSPEAALWKSAMDEEINTLHEMGTWEKKDLPE